MALEQKDAARATLRDLKFKVRELGLALESPDCTEEARKAYLNTEKMANLFKAEMTRNEEEIVALDEQDNAIDSTL